MLRRNSSSTRTARSAPRKRSQPASPAGCGDTCSSRAFPELQVSRVIANDDREKYMVKELQGKEVARRGQPDCDLRS